MLSKIPIHRDSFTYHQFIEGDANKPSSRSGLSNLYKKAFTSSRLLVVRRISNQKVIPWMVYPTGAIRCFDTAQEARNKSSMTKTKATWQFWNNSDGAQEARNKNSMTKTKAAGLFWNNSDGVF
ncbi:Uncharacterized protein Fot_06386 [Forsythia ovata]|uniref:Uncharacterized protein n=1 Tax=Forsythia ovata TaxID=205694 RepID=A0ABD1WT80_9LAMI